MHGISITSVTQPTVFYRRMMHEEDVRPPNEKSHVYHLALLSTDVIFAY